VLSIDVADRERRPMRVGGVQMILRSEAHVELRGSIRDRLRSGSRAAFPGPGRLLTNSPQDHLDASP
jgi:hypothetical protein